MDFERCSEDLATPQVVVEENNRKFRIQNPHRNTVKKIYVDGCLIDDKRPRCDYIFEIGKECHCAVYLELKGADIDKAFSQLVATLGYIRPRHDATRIVCHIVASRVPRAGTKVQNLKVQMARNYDVQLFVGTREVSIDVELTPYSKPT